MLDTFWNGFADEVEKFAGPAADRVLAEAIAARKAAMKGQPLLHRLLGIKPPSPAALRAASEVRPAGAASAVLADTAGTYRPKPSWSK